MAKKTAEWAELEKRLSKLESTIKALQKTEAKQRKLKSQKPELVSEEDFGLLERLRSRKGRRYEHGDIRGAITYAGAITIGDKASLWMREHSIPEILHSDQEVIARILTALGNVSRIAIVLELIGRRRSAPELQERLDIQSTGQLYHHLKELLAAGIISQPKRSNYEVSAHKLIPVLNILGTVADFFLNSSELESNEGEK